MCGCWSMKTTALTAVVYSLWYWFIYLVFMCSSLFVLHLPGSFLCITGANLFLTSPESTERPPSQTFIFVQRRAASSVRAFPASKKMSPVRHRDEWQAPTTAPDCREIQIMKRQLLVVITAVAVAHLSDSRT